MTDQPDPGFEREERAFRAALEEHAGDIEPHDLAAPTRPVRRRRTWLAAAAAAVVVIGGAGITTAVLAGGGGGGSGTAGSEQGSSSLATDGAGKGRSTLRGGRSVAAVLPDAASGMQWVSRYDVAVQVPSSWSYAQAPSKPECVQKAGDTWDNAPRHPYVGLDPSFFVMPMIACPDPRPDVPAEFVNLPLSLWQPYLTFARTDDGAGGVEAGSAGTAGGSTGASGSDGSSTRDGTWSYRGWTLTRWTVGGVQLSLLTRTADADLAARIKESTTRFEVDQNGCPATSDVQAAEQATPSSAASASRLTPSSVSVCQYLRGSDGAGLVASRRLTGSEMGGLLRGIAAAPSGSGPDQGSGCPATASRTAIELRFNRAGGGVPATAYVYYGGCDDGIHDSDSVSRLTSADCRPLFAGAPIMPDVASVLEGVCTKP